MKNVMCHLRVCDPDRVDCPFTNCRSSRQLLQHWQGCQLADCKICSPFRKIVPAYIENAMKIPIWREMIVKDYQWLIKLMGVKNIANPATGNPTDPSRAWAANVPSQDTENNGNQSENPPEVIQID